MTDFTSLHEPSRESTLKLREAADQLADDLRAQDGGSERFHKDAADSFYDELYEAACAVEVQAERAALEDARREATAERMAHHQMMRGAA